MYLMQVVKNGNDYTGRVVEKKTPVKSVLCARIVFAVYFADSRYDSHFDNGVDNGKFSTSLWGCLLGKATHLSFALQ